VYSDWKAATPINTKAFSDNTCNYLGVLEENIKLSETAYQNGVILIYQKTPAISSIDYTFPESIRSIPFSSANTPFTGAYDSYSFILTSRLFLNFSRRDTTSYKKFDDCEKPANAAAFLKDVVYRYVLIPVPSAKSKPTFSSLSTPLERAQAWYGLNDLSYASVKQRFGLKD